MPSSQVTKKYFPIIDEKSQVSVALHMDIFDKVLLLHASFAFPKLL